MNEVYDVPYMQRTRDYYRAQGYTNDYQWAQNSATPFCMPAKPLSECRVGIVTTAMPDTDLGRNNRKIHSTLVPPIPESMYTEELSWHKTVTHTDDVNSFIPLEQLMVLEDEGGIGSLAPRFHSVPTEYSQRTTLKYDAPEILARLREDEVDITILVPL
ncbi:MAG: glycine/sarcosine/betaine reductase selenoprotein B family protein [Gammaproteobacteria bacterium]|nr:glycine/sarcosine/betaine reductase selenoprotein B family protein [Gammaproteobacteria bacterium]